MCLHSAELNVVAVTENVNTFLLVWTHVSRYGVNWLYCCQVYKVLTAVFISTLELSTFIFISYFIHLSIDLLSLTPRSRATATVGKYVPIFFRIGFMGFRIRQRRWIVKPEWPYLGIFVYHSLVMMFNFVCYLDGNKPSGSQFELHTH